MRFTLSALSLAQSMGRDFLYAWPQTDLFKPALTNLWHFDHTEIPWAESVKINKTYPYVKDAEALNKADMVWHLRSGDAVTIPDGAPSWAQRLRELIPAAVIQERVIDTFQPLAGAPYVGVSIRTNHMAHAKTLKMSPIEWYIGRMNEIRQSYSDVKFFISCDVPEVQERLIATYPESVALTDKGGYNSTEGVMASVVDTYLLASSSYILAPYWSSFPVLAWELSGRSIPIEDSCSGRKDFEIADSSLALNPLRPSDRREKTLKTIS
ncbi:hypothetical protein [Arthrobacter sp. 7Tela_A1]|uniref:hypothetical protein n=1 Tax=Arthrobacter sp. 7Tela_A1 TaxID=3093745 RepID=UPI003BB7C53C